MHLNISQTREGKRLTWIFAVLLLSPVIRWLSLCWSLFCFVSDGQSLRFGTRTLICWWIVGVLKLKWRM